MRSVRDIRIKYCMEYFLARNSGQLLEAPVNDTKMLLKIPAILSC